MKIYIKIEGLTDQLNADLEKAYPSFVYKEDCKQLIQQIRDLFANKLNTVVLPKKAIVVVEEHTVDFDYGDQSCYDYRAAVHYPAK